MQVKDLKKQYRVVRRDNLLKKGDDYYEFIVRDKDLNRYFETIEECKEVIERDKKLWNSNKPLVAGSGLAISSEKVEHDFEYRIEWRWISKFEEVKG